jgi:hypothetical protein
VLLLPPPGATTLPGCSQPVVWEGSQVADITIQEFFNSSHEIPALGPHRVQPTDSAGDVVWMAVKLSYNSRRYITKLSKRYVTPVSVA